MIDASSWPIVRWTTPETIPDEQAASLLAEFDRLLAKGERFVLIFDGVERPERSAAFNRLYKDWFKARRHELGRLVMGAVRVEPSEARRKAVMGKLMNAALAAFMPYPFKVVGSESAARAAAAQWLVGRGDA